MKQFFLYKMYGITQAKKMKECMISVIDIRVVDEVSIRCGERGGGRGGLIATTGR